MKSGKRFLAFVMSILMVLTVLVPSNIFASSTDATAEDAQDEELVGVTDVGTFTNPTATSLESVNNFAVFAKTYNQVGSDMEGTIATNYFSPSGDTVGVTTNIGSDFDPSCEINYFNTVSDLSKLPNQIRNFSGNSTVIFGNGITITGTSDTMATLTDGTTTKTLENGLKVYGKNVINVSNSSYVIDFDAAFNALKTYSSAKYDSSMTAGTSVTYYDKTTDPNADQNNYKITISCVKGENIVNISASDLATHKLYVNGTQPYSLVINVTDTASTGTYSFSKDMFIDGVGYDAYGTVGTKVLWNFGSDYTGTTSYNNSNLMGAILAPSGTIIINPGSHNGSVFANTVENHNCEIHQNGYNQQGKISVKKVAAEDTTKTLRNAVFGIFSDSACTNQVATITTGSDGAGTSDDLIIGTYYVKETTPPSGYNLNGTVYKIVVLSGNTVVVQDGTSGYVTDTKDTTVPTPAAFSLTAAKTVDGKPPVSDQVFSFKLHNTVSPEGATAIEDKTVTNNLGVITFDGITLDKAGNYEFEVTETGTYAGYTTDTSTYTAHVPVTLNANNALVCGPVTYTKGTESATGITFNNTTVAPTSAILGLSATKTVDGQTPAADQTFNFTLKNTNKPEGASAIADQTKSNALGAITFDNMTLDKAGDYEFQVTEDAVSSGYEKDASVYTASVTVTLNKETNTLECGTVTYKKGTDNATEIAFNNTTVAPTAAKLNLTAEKTVDYSTPTEGETFSFTLKNPVKPAGASTISNQTKTNNLGVIAFDEISLDKAGNYEFEVTETGDVLGYVKDSSTYTAYVTVTKNTTNKLEVTAITYKKGTESADNITFNNSTVAPGPATLNLTASKKVDGNAPATGETFSFLLHNTKVPAGAAAIDDQTKSNVLGAITFDTVSLNKAGDYEFQVTETGSKVGYTLDSSTFTVYVTVAKDTATNTLKSSVTYKKDGTSVDKISFNNTTVSPDAAKLTLSATKTVDNAAPAAGETFSFLLHNTTKPDGATAIEDQTKTNTLGTINYSEMTLDREGTYVFEVKETGNYVGYTTDTTVYTATVNVTKNATTNKLEVGTVTYSDGKGSVSAISFNNTTVAPTAASLSLNATKTVDGRTPAEGETFSFFLKNTLEPDGAATITDQTKSNVSGAIAFDAMNLDKAGDYQFQITETGTKTGFTLDSSTYTAYVTVTKDSATNELKCGSVTYKKDGAAAAAVTFNNETVSAEAAKLTLSAAKTVDEAAPVTGETFSFLLHNTKKPDAASAIADQTKENVLGAINFGEMTLDAEGTYEFQVTETGTYSGYTIDSSVYTATVTVTKNAVTNELECGTVTYKNGTKEAQSILFNNKTVAPTAASLKLTAEKTVDGQTPATGETFSFLLHNTKVPAGAAAIDDQTKSNVLGAITFDTISLNKAGDYEFQVTETGSKTGYTLDSSTYTVYATVTKDTATNTLKSSVTYKKDGTSVDKISFNNTTVSPDAAKLTLSATKTVDNAAPAEGETFSFLLHNTTKPDGATAIDDQTKTNKLGTIDFSEMTLDAEGTYVFEVKETGTYIGYTTDENVYTASVTVTKDALTNKLKCGNVTFKKGTESAQAISFNNTTIAPTAAILNIGATKTVDGKVPQKAKYSAFFFIIQRHHQAQLK